MSSSLESICATVSDITDVSVAEMQGKERTQHIVRARHIYATIARRHGYSMPAIARFINRDHTTILSSLRRAEDLARHDFDFCEMLADASIADWKRSV